MGKALGGRLISQKAIRFGDHAGREFIISWRLRGGHEFIFYSRAFVYKSKVITVSVSAPEGAGNATARNEYFASLKLK
jgi:hypothetical protein